MYNVHNAITIGVMHVNKKNHDIARPVLVIACIVLSNMSSKYHVEVSPTCYQVNIGKHNATPP